MDSNCQSFPNQNIKKTIPNSPKWKWPTNGKENLNPSVKLRNILSSNQAEQVMKDVKANASKTLTNVKITFDSLSQKLRRSSRKCSTARKSYEELDNKFTPVKLYSPFGIETPSPRKEARISDRRRRLTPRKFAFVSPTGKLRKDIDELESGMKELHTVAKSVRNRRLH